MSRSSSVLAYRPAGAGQKDRQARFDLGLIPDPRAWLEQRLGPLVHFEVIDGTMPDSMASVAGGTGDVAAEGDGVAASHDPAGLRVVTQLCAVRHHAV